MSTAGYSGAQANGKSALTTSAGLFEPDELPILHANPGGPDRAGRRELPARPDWLRAGTPPVPGRGRDNPAVIVRDLPGDPGPTDVYWDRDGTRELRDTRVGARQP